MGGICLLNGVAGQGGGKGNKFRAKKGWKADD